jgi:hypothetical protein
MQSLFPTGASSQSQTPFFQFRAGKCQMSPLPNGKFLVSADLRRGQVSLVKGSDALVHFRWSNFSNGSVEDDRIIMPGEAVLKRVKAGTENDRVFLLKFQYGNNNRLMFWMQDKDPSKDAEIFKKMNDYLKGGASVVPDTANPSGSGQQQDLMQLLG